MKQYVIGDSPVIGGTVSATLEDGDEVVVHVKRPDGSVVAATDATATTDPGGWEATFDSADLEQLGWHVVRVRVTFVASGITKTYAHDSDDSELGFETLEAWEVTP